MREEGYREERTRFVKKRGGEHIGGVSPTLNFSLLDPPCRANARLTCFWQDAADRAVSSTIALSTGSDRWRRRPMQKERERERRGPDDRAASHGVRACM